MRILIATHNNGKLNEFKELLKNLEIDFLTLDDFPTVLEPDEFGNTLIENALIKAKYYFDKFQTPVICDDTGLFIEALNYEPGINTARYSGLGDKANREKVLDNLKTSNRNAYFETSLVFYDGKNILTSTGRLNGEIAEKEKGENGFGYDSIFLIPRLSKTLAEISQKEKNQFSHRHNAIEGLALKLSFLLNKTTHIDYINDLCTKLFPTNKIQQITKLSGGMSNDTYLIEFDCFLKVVRIPGFSADIYVDRSKELYALNCVKGSENFLQYDYFDEVTGVKVSPYIESSSEMLSEQELNKTLKKLHSLPKLPFDYKAFDRLAYYIRLNNIFDVNLKEEFYQIYKKILLHKEELEKRNKVFCHNDNQISNFLNNGQGVLIDFEFVGNNDELFDYACFGNNDLNIGIKAYQTINKINLKESKRIIELWYVVQALNWYLVATFKDATGLSKSLNLDFDEIATMFLNKAKKLIN